MESLEAAEPAEVETFFAREWPVWDEDVDALHVMEKKLPAAGQSGS